MSKPSHALLKASLVTGLILAAASGGAALNYLVSPSNRAEQGDDRSRLAIIDLPDVPLVDQFGKRQALRAQFGKHALVVVNFNYTTCESICPVGNALMKEIDDTASSRMERPIRLASITIDPRTDTPTVMRKAAADFAPSKRWLWLTGEPDDIDTLLASLGAKAPDITLHTPLFLIGDLETGNFQIIRTQPEAREVLATLEKFDL